MEAQQESFNEWLSQYMEDMEESSKNAASATTYESGNKNEGE